MSQLKEFHDEAMRLADQAHEALRKGDEASAKLLFFDAFQHDFSAARLVLDRYEAEPTRGMLFSSAAALAYQAGDDREAEKMIGFGLSGNPTSDIAADLRGLLKLVNSRRQRSSVQDRAERQATRARRRESPSSVVTVTAATEQVIGTFEFTGELRGASSRTPGSQAITIVDRVGKGHPVLVPSGVSDIVKPLWEEMVVVRASKVKRGRRTVHILQNIRRATEDEVSATA